MPRVFTSWKEIAAHLGKGVRTVQRWEHELGLPVRRPKGGRRSPVLAHADELDAWLHNRFQPRADGHVAPGDLPQTVARKQATWLNSRTLLADSIKLHRELRAKQHQLGVEVSKRVLATTQAAAKLMKARKRGGGEYGN